MASRSTFRDVVDSGIAWQRQLRDSRLAEGVPPITLDLSAALVRPISRRLAESIILKYEWLGTMDLMSSLFFGVFFGMYCAGVTCVAVKSNGTAGRLVAKPYGLQREDVATLTRGACVHWAPTGTNSRLVSWTCRLLARARAAKIILAYADPSAGEIGTIYQACNWAYVGDTESARPDQQLVAPNGRVIARRTLYSYATTAGCDIPTMRRRLKAHGWVEQPDTAKHRYVYVLDRSDRALVARVESMRRLYPKRQDYARNIS